MFNQVLSAALVGLNAVPVWVEADVSDGLPSFSMVGSLGHQVRESQDRIRTALKNMSLALPPKRITINLSPADIHKEGTRFDLAIALAILMSVGRVKDAALDHVMVVGELSLDGSVNAVPGVLGTVMAAREQGCHMCLVPMANLKEGRLIDKIKVYGVAHLSDAIRVLNEGYREQEGVGDKPLLNQYKEDFSEILGQASVKRSALIAVSGFHNMLMSGPPGAGKTLVARRLVTILPPLSMEESLEITQIYSVAGLLKDGDAMMTRRPFRSPHHTATAQALSGGGRIPRPGEITLAHRGVLFLDEVPEFPRNTLEILRQPLEDRQITIARASGSYVFPANFLLLAAMNPCPCGYWPDMNRCRCREGDILRYHNKLSQPLLDRIDIRTEVRALGYDVLKQTGRDAIDSAQLREQAERVHKIQRQRYKGADFMYNAEIPSRAIGEFCPMTTAAELELEKIFNKMSLSARGYHRLIKLSRTIADLDGAEVIDVPHIKEAFIMRSPDGRQGLGI
ncbi:MAG: YifB family Mg chelatase-like AAA ATPase [Lachnospiraceae bacterium]|nr:YifB family Mg chelatase-like AAA ATPase [Candidatus Equihabitans merdae]